MRTLIRRELLRFAVSMLVVLLWAALIYGWSELALRALWP